MGGGECERGRITVNNRLYENVESIFTTDIVMIATMVAQAVQPPPIPRRTMSLEFKQYAIVDDNTLMSEVLRETEGSQLSGCCASDLVCLSIHPSTLPPL